MTVVVAVDSSDRSAEAIRLADRESRYRNSPLIAMTAYQSGRATGVPGGKPIGTMQTGAEARESAAAALREAVRRALGENSASVQLRAVGGPTGRAITETAREAAADLIVLAVRPAMPMLPGTVSQYVVRHARQPVLVVPDLAHPFAS